MTSLRSANTLAEFIMSLQNVWRHFAGHAWAKCDRKREQLTSQLVSDKFVIKRQRRF